MTPRVIITIIVFLALTMAWVAAAQPTTYPTNPPAWYNASLPAGQVIIYTNNITGPTNTSTTSHFEDWSGGSIYDTYVTVYTYSSSLNFYFTSRDAVRAIFDITYYVYGSGTNNITIWVDNVKVATVADNKLTAEVSMQPGSNIHIYFSCPGANLIEYKIYFYNVYYTSGVNKIQQNLYNIIIINYTETEFINATVRAPAGQAFVSTNASDYWLDEAYIDAPGTYVFEWAPYFRLENNATLAYSDGVYNVTGPAYIAPLPNKITCNGVAVEPVFPGDDIKCAPAPSNAVNVSFTVRQYGTNYSVLQLSTPTGEIVGRKYLDSLGQAVIPCAPYATYYVYFMAPGETRLFGALVISQTAYVFDVLPAAPPQPSAGNVTAWWDGGLLRIAGTCPSPPCYITVTKHLENGTDVVAANLTVSTAQFSIALNLSDPWTTVDVFGGDGGLIGRAYAGYTQLLNATHVQRAQQFIGWLAQYMSPDGSPAFIIAIGAVLVFLAFSTVGSLLTGGIALAAYLAVAGPLGGYYPLGAGGAILLIALLALHYISRKMG